MKENKLQITESEIKSPNDNNSNTLFNDRLNNLPSHDLVSQYHLQFLQHLLIS